MATYYFASDMHLGMEAVAGEAAARETVFIRWLDEIAADADAVFLMGDVFDFWFEYKRVVPKGFARTIAKLEELTSRGIEVWFFSGNHDMWARDYLSVEAGVHIVHGPEVMKLDGKRVFLAHGDNLLTRGAGAKLMNWAFHNPAVRTAFRWAVHPDLAMKFGQWWSRTSRSSKQLAHDFKNEEEPLVLFSRGVLRQQHIDYFVFGHIHTALDYDLGGNSRALFLGEWIANPAYAVMRDGEITLKRFSV